MCQACDDFIKIVNRRVAGIDFKYPEVKPDPVIEELKRMAGEKYQAIKLDQLNKTIIEAMTKENERKLGVQEITMPETKDLFESGVTLETKEGGTLTLDPSEFKTFSLRTLINIGEFLVVSLIKADDEPRYLKLRFGRLAVEFYVQPKLKGFDTAELAGVAPDAVARKA